MTIAAIETTYAGCRFRSRLEARWAVFFDHMSIDWEYEPEGYILSDGTHYLPDFRLDGHAWVEVKGHDAALNHDLLYRAAAELPGYKPYEGCPTDLVILGQIPNTDELRRVEGDAAWSCPLPTVALNGDGTYTPERAAQWVAFGHYFRKRQLLWYVTHDSSQDTPTTKYLITDELIYDERVVKAYEAARKARFEHGESG